jgi:superkiller protein 3
VSGSSGSTKRTRLPRPERGLSRASLRGGAPLLLLAVLLLSLAGCGPRTDPRIQEGYDLVVAGRIDEAVALANALLVDDPENAPARNLLGLALYKAGDAEGSINQYLQALEIRPDYAEAHFNLGNSYRMLGQRQEAESSYLAAIRAEGDFVLAHYNLGILYERTGRIDQALAEYRRCVDEDPQFYYGFVSLGKLLYEQQDPEGAVANLSRALEMDPSTKELRVLLGNAYLQSDRPDGKQLAENEFRAAAGIDPDYLDAVYSVGVALAAQNRNDEAAEWFAKARTLAEGNPDKAAILQQVERFFREYGEPPPAGDGGSAG